MTWRYILKQLAFPPSCFLLLLILSLLIRKRWPKLAITSCLMSIIGLYIMSLPITVEYAARVLETETALDPVHWPSLSQHADAIVVLGGGRETNDPAWQNDQPSLMAMQRIRYAARIAKASQLPLLTSGGLHYGQPPSEAQIMADIFTQDFALTTRWLEGESRTTWENARFSAAMLQAEGVHRIVLVTQAWHMPRSRWSYEQFGFEVISAPVGFLSGPNRRPLNGWIPESKALWHNTALLNEAIGALLYRLHYSPLL
ncbi:YdcF family protein [Denitrificimonas sp. JX-1]|uniref:YdcF family protein n=1 Tax=Denitrificimonas halotolerans TaxID=3098930 RepID=A0ABU5GUC6_9GAMM|nr:YdcF family protein [Denitrificimonas sp. JX-1]MDY7219238.1 YdcF family protein [Denitrificimonas sp. JX-1]